MTFNYLISLYARINVNFFLQFLVLEVEEASVISRPDNGYIGYNYEEVITDNVLLRFIYSLQHLN